MTACLHCSMLIHFTSSGCTSLCLWALEVFGGFGQLHLTSVKLCVHQESLDLIRLQQQDRFGIISSNVWKLPPPPLLFWKTQSETKILYVLLRAKGMASVPPAAAGTVWLVPLSIPASLQGMEKIWCYGLGGYLSSMSLSSYHDPLIISQLKNSETRQAPGKINKGWAKLWVLKCGRERWFLYPYLRSKNMAMPSQKTACPQRYPCQHIFS